MATSATRTFIFALALALTACGSSAADDSDTGGSDDTSVEESPDASNAPPSSVQDE